MSFPVVCKSPTFPRVKLAPGPPANFRKCQIGVSRSATPRSAVSGHHRCGGAGKMRSHCHGFVWSTWDFGDCARERDRQSAHTQRHPGPRHSLTTPSHIFGCILVGARLVIPVSNDCSGPLYFCQNPPEASLVTIVPRSGAVLSEGEAAYGGGRPRRRCNRAAMSSPANEARRPQGTAGLQGCALGHQGGGRGRIRCPEAINRSGTIKSHAADL